MLGSCKADVDLVLVAEKRPRQNDLDAIVLSDSPHRVRKLEGLTNTRNGLCYSYRANILRLLGQGQPQKGPPNLWDVPFQRLVGTLKSIPMKPIFTEPPQF